MTQAPSPRIPLWVLERLVGLPADFTGSVSMNFFRGGIANINITESVKPTSGATNAHYSVKEIQTTT